MTTPRLPPHGPGCKPLPLRSSRFAGELRYVCAANCPRKKALAKLDREADDRAVREHRERER